MSGFGALIATLQNVKPVVFLFWDTRYLFKHSCSLSKPIRQYAVKSWGHELSILICNLVRQPNSSSAKRVIGTKFPVSFLVDL